MPRSRAGQTVYRLRNLPAHVDRLATTELIAAAINDDSLTPGDVQVFSLATIPDSWRRWQTKVATLMFKTTPSALLASQTEDSNASEWRFTVLGFQEPLILDIHFLGLTVLNDVNSSYHEFDCVVISGLASHPFGSWQPKGDDKSFMWIRDALPTNFPSIRFLLYGYNTALVNSNSFQTVVDLGSTLMTELEANGWASPGAKPLVFIAHSLGGVLFKQLLIILADGNSRATFMLKLIKGAIFFGTPSAGMPFASLRTMVESQPNQDFVNDLSTNSPFLEGLEKQFSGISYLARMKFFWAYETKTSPTVVKVGDGSYQRSGPTVIMVDKQSATGGRYTKDPSSTMQIDEDHSGMVKFSSGDHRIATVVSKIRDICWPEQQLASSIAPAVPEPEELGDELDPSDDFDMQGPGPTGTPDSNGWNYDLTLHILQSPDRNSRLEQIDESFGHTFDWAFEDASVGLSQWLRKGTGIYWISGKPGSGKSTLMKFLLKSPRTAELIHNWKSKSTQIILNFFFHHRGTLMQKSMDGLMSSLVAQLLEKEPRLWQVTCPILDARLKRTMGNGRYSAAQADMQRFLRTSTIAFREPRYQEQLLALLSSDPISSLDAIVSDEVPAIGKEEQLTLKRVILGEYEKISINSHGMLHDEIERIWREAPKYDECNFAQFRKLVETWSQSIDVEASIRKLLLRCGLLGPTQGNSGNAAYLRDSSKLPTLKKHLKELVKRHQHRSKTHLDAQLAQWTKGEIEECLSRIMEQDILDLDLCIFFDALDEYDGTPEVISELLQDLIRQASSSRTKARILFSSRPWPVFQKAFESCSGFKLHEHTYEDIREYCTGLLPQDDALREMMLPLIQDITDSARGVFLWVRLVMRDFLSIISGNQETSEELSLKLQECLKSAPVELHDYYTTIIQRLPSTTRRETYILLESLSRSISRILLSDVPRIIKSGLSQSCHEVEPNFKVSDSTTLEELDEYTRAISGGLVDKNLIQAQTGPQEFIKESNSTDPANYYLQLLHQTCKEWVDSAAFKHTVLGHRATMVRENGHSFRAKYHASLRLPVPIQAPLTDVERFYFFWHVQEAERTTGVSQHEYISRLPSVVCQQYLPQYTKDPPPSGLSLAVFAWLWLYLEDSIKENPRIFQNTKEKLFSVLLSWEGADPIEVGKGGALEIATFLLRHGFDLRNDADGVSMIMTHLWESPARAAAQLWIDLIIEAINYSLPPDTVITGSSRLFSHDKEWCLLHVSPPPLTRRLLQGGAAVNCLNKYKQTPLDYVLDPGSVHQGRGFGKDWLYEQVCLLVEHGAQLRYYTSAHFDSFVKSLAKEGFDTSLIASPQQMHQGPGMDAVQKFKSKTDKVATSPEVGTAHGSTRRRDRLKKLFRTE